MDRFDLARISRWNGVGRDFRKPPGQMNFPGGRTFPKSADRLERDADFLAAFPDQGFRFRFSGLDASTGKAIDQRSNNFPRTPDYQHPSIAQSNRHCAAPSGIVGYFFHENSLYTLVSRLLLICKRLIF
jgi:hypothetical protein